MIFIAAFAVALSAILWHMGGQGQKWARALGVPAVIAIAKLIMTGSWWVLLYAPALWGMLSLFSYGLKAPPHKFWVWVFGKGDDGSYQPVEIATRATCGLFWSLAAITFTWITMAWSHQIAYTIFLSSSIAFFGTVKDVRVSEMGSGAAVAFAVLI